MTYAPPELVPDMQRRIDEGAAEAGRRPAEIRRIYNLPDEITEAPAAELLHGQVEHWVETLTGFAIELGFDTFIFWPGGDAPVRSSASRKRSSRVSATRSREPAAAAPRNSTYGRGGSESRS
jgi:hypothetical protein